MALVAAFAMGGLVASLIAFLINLSALGLACYGTALWVGPDAAIALCGVGLYYRPRLWEPGTYPFKVAIVSAPRHAISSAPGGDRAKRGHRGQH